MPVCSVAPSSLAKLVQPLAFLCAVTFAVGAMAASAAASETGWLSPWGVQMAQTTKDPDELLDDEDELLDEEEPEKKAAPADEQKGVGRKASEAHEALFAEARYPSAGTCGTCHPKQYREWAVSQHSYA